VNAAAISSPERDDVGDKENQPHDGETAEHFEDNVAEHVAANESGPRAILAHDPDAKESFPQGLSGSYKHHDLHDLDTDAIENKGVREDVRGIATPGIASVALHEGHFGRYHQSRAKKQGYARNNENGQIEYARPDSGPPHLSAEKILIARQVVAQTNRRRLDLTCVT
jgi:hypothetical protein